MRWYHRKEKYCKEVRDQGVTYTLSRRVVQISAPKQELANGI
jgi:hypothetical protein